MLRHRVTIPTMKQASRSHPDLTVAVADIVTQDESLSVPALVARVIKDIVRERAPTPPVGIITSTSNITTASTTPAIGTYTPFIMEPAFSGADTDLDSTDNRTLITPIGTGLQVKCDTILLPTTTPVPIRLYLTGKEVDLAIDGQRCTIDVFGPEGYTKRLAVAKRDTHHAVYLEIQDKGVPWCINHNHETIRFHLDSFFILK